ncbi:MAG: hypothetical protein IPK15_00185 [Verrucomicrobia bacterium]|nr:hypothetical protein [Verrucomicrobiota bacterium]
MKRLFVRPAFPRRGIGRALAERLIQRTPGQLVITRCASMRWGA